MSIVSDAVDRCAEAIRSSAKREWVIGYSGGKDSTAALKIFLNAMKLAGRQSCPVSVIYCDTGVENPELDVFAKATLRRLKAELSVEFPKSAVEILSPPVAERFFVRVIGRGYAPPTNRFRWCTKGLRILPVQRYLRGRGTSAAVVLGLRFGESVQRDRSLNSAGGAGSLWQKQKEGAAQDLLLPIIDFGLEEVWLAAQVLSFPASIDALGLEELYRDASDECPMIRSPLSPPCASGRFGCWTCTVVRKDRSTEQMIRNGKVWLAPYLEFRNWLQSFREDPYFRWPVRRNGAAGPGPFTIAGRRRILRQVELLEAEVDRELLSHEELQKIWELWAVDRPLEMDLGLT